MGTVGTVIAGAITTVAGAVSTRGFVIVAIALTVAPLQLIVRGHETSKGTGSVTYWRGTRATPVAVRIASAGVPVLVAAVLVRTCGRW